MTREASTPARLPRVIGEWGLAAAIFNVTVGAAIFVLPAHTAASLGAAAPLAYGLCAVATALVALCFAEATSRLPRIGGPYACIEVAFGRNTGFVCGVLLWLGVTIAMGAVSTVFGDVLGRLIPIAATGPGRAVALFLVLGGLAALNVRGTSMGAVVSIMSTLAKIAPLLVFIALGFPNVRPGNLGIPTLPPIGDLAEASLLLMFAFFGMETALQMSGEVRNAARAIPRAIAKALIGVLFLYLAVQLVAQGVLGATLASPENAKAPLAAAAGVFAGSAGSGLILVGMAISTFGFLTATTLSLPRTLFALAGDGLLPKVFASTHARFGTPHIAIIVQAVVVCAIALSGTYVQLAVISDTAILVVYLACCLGVLRLRKLDVRTEGDPFTMPGGAIVPWLASALIAGLIAHSTPLALGLTAGVMAVSSAVFLLRRRAEDTAGR